MDNEYTEDDDVIEDPYTLEIKEQARRREAARAERERHLAQLFGSDNRYDWEAPPPVADLDAQLGEHVAQLRNAVRFQLAYTLDADMSLKSNILSANAVDRLIRTNLAIIKALKAAPPKSKTVRCGETGQEQQD